MAGDLWVLDDIGGGVAEEAAAVVGLGAFGCLRGLCVVGVDEGVQCDTAGAFGGWIDGISLFATSAFAASFVFDSDCDDFLRTVCA